jgi:hypothetical protein
MLSGALRNSGTNPLQSALTPSVKALAAFARNGSCLKAPRLLAKSTKLVPDVGPELGAKVIVVVEAQPPVRT